MGAKTTFEVTEKAGVFVAGQRSPGAGKPVQLTEEQAHYALITGELRRPLPKSTEPVPAKSKKD